MEDKIPPVHLIVRLTLPDKPPKEFSYDFRQEAISLGRDPHNDIQIPLTTVSRNHARIFYELGDYFLEDLGSTHGTKHNQKRLGRREKKLLRDGDEIDIISFSITFKTAPARMLDRQPGERTEQLARRMVQEVLASLGGEDMDPTSLRIMNGVDEGKRFEIGEDQAEVVLGRSPDCDVVLDDQNASRRHCLIKRTWNGFTAQDLGSKNGVLVNGERIESVHGISDGDEIQVGGVKLSFIDPASRILDQFGGLAERTVQPGEMPDTDQRDAEDVGAAGYEEDEDEFPEDDDDDFGGEEPEEMESEESFGEEEEEEDGLDEEPEIEIDEEQAAQFAAAANKGIGAEVVILILGLGIFVGAIALAVFLYL